MGSNSANASRVLARQLARTLTEAELNFVSGGDELPEIDGESHTPTYTGCGSYGCSDGDKK